MCLGRCDNQVKIRGFRIELSEIDTNILTYSSIKHTISVIQDINNIKTIILTHQDIDHIGNVKDILNLVPDIEVITYDEVNCGTYD